MFAMGAMSIRSNVLLRRSFTSGSGTLRRAGVVRRAAVASAATPKQSHYASAYDCECCPPGSPFLFRLPNTRFAGLSTRSVSSGGPAVLASTVPTSSNTVAEELVDYLNKSWTSFHATAESARMLSEAGFVRLSERDEWELQKGGRYFFTRNMSSIVAFAVGEKYTPGNGFNIIGAHTDSPCPKLKPVSAVTKGGFLQVGVQTYGGGLWHTWFDRDLSVAGRVLLRRGRNDGRTSHELVRVARPILRIPTLAIHLDRTIGTDGFKPNTETHLAPLLSTAIKGELNTETVGKEEKDGKEPTDSKDGKASKDKNKPNHHPLLLAVLAEELDCDPHEIVDFELEVCDTQPSVIGGAAREFIYSGRLDNLASSFCALRAILDAGGGGSLREETGVRMVTLFDNEEVGSDSTAGAGGTVLADAVHRTVQALCGASPGEGLAQRTARNSFLVSADMAHALHPNYMDKHETNHAPAMHKGVVVKHNANQRYATTSVTATLFRECAAVENVPTQDFVVRNDMGCGSTIGPILSTNLGIRTVDVGVPQLSMHSIREMCGTEDIEICAKHFTAFFDHFAKIDAQFDDADA
jgi:aspartyl aminopeptidase